MTAVLDCGHGRCAGELARVAGFGLLWDALGRDLQRSIRSGLDVGARFRAGRTPLEVFRHAISVAVRDIEGHERGRLVQRFIRDGPYGRPGRVPSTLKGKRLTDAETASAVSFVHGHMVNCFQGALAELLGVRPALKVLAALRSERAVPAITQLYVGDVIRARREPGGGTAKAADYHFLATEGERLKLLGVGEVKSYGGSTSKIARQLARHGRRAVLGLAVVGRTGSSELAVGAQVARRLAQLRVRPARWKLPRGFRIDERAGRTFVVPDVPVPPAAQDRIDRISPTEWNVTLRWSQEALASAAYGISFWYMEQVGEILFRSAGASPWPEMTPAEAGVNAAKQALYYAILRAGDAGEQQRAIALYNTYGFGYALGMNFRDARRRREMLWPQDLREIQACGRTSSGSRIVRTRLEAARLPS